MSTLCVCGHAKSQHPNKECDYKGYTCSCSKYRKQGSVARIVGPTDLLSSSLEVLFSKPFVVVGFSRSTYTIQKVKK